MTSPPATIAGEQRLQSTGSLVDAAIRLPRTDRTLVVRQPTDLDLLLDRSADDPEQNLPYWAEIWPSGIALADAVLAQPELVRGRRVLEIGCGLGVTAAAALIAGADLLAADYSPESLLLCRHNALRNTGRAPEIIELNWRNPSPEMLDLAPGGFPVVLAADVLYERRDIEPLLVFASRIVAPGGLLWLAEPGRPPAAAFLASAGAAGWTGPSATHTGPWPDPKDQGVVVHLHLLERPSP